MSLETLIIEITACIEHAEREVRRGTGQEPGDATMELAAACWVAGTLKGLLRRSGYVVPIGLIEPINRDTAFLVRLDKSEVDPRLAEYLQDHSRASGLDSLILGPDSSKISTMSQLPVINSPPPKGISPVPKIVTIPGMEEGIAVLASPPLEPGGPPQILVFRIHEARTCKNADEGSGEGRTEEQGYP